MAKLPTPDTMPLTVRERILLFCVGSGTDWQRVVPNEAVTDMMVEGFISRDVLGRLTLTVSGRAALLGAVAGAVRAGSSRRCLQQPSGATRRPPLHCC